MEAFRSLRHRNFRLFFYGQSISLLGNWIQKTAVVWLVYRLTGSALLLGITGFVNLIPSLLLSPYAGSYIDRHDRFTVIKNIQKINMLQSGILATLVFFQAFHVWTIILLVLVQGITDAFEVTCRQSLMLEMIDDKADLPNAIALNSTMANLARVAGPAVAGLLLSTVGEDGCFISNFLSYIPVILFMRAMRLNTTPADKPQQNVWEGLKEGLEYIRSDREITGLLLLLASSSLLLIPFITLVPVFAKDLFHGTSRTFSLFESAMGLGAVLSAVYMARLKSGDPLIKMAVVATLIFSAGLLVLATATNLHMALLGMTISGAGMMVQTSSINTYIQTHAAPEQRARAISYFVMAYLGVTPLGSLLIGWLAEYLRPEQVVRLQGLLGLLLAAGYAAYRRHIKQPLSFRI